MGSGCRLHPTHIPRLLLAKGAGSPRRPGGRTASPWAASWERAPRRGALPPAGGALAESGAPSACSVLTATRPPGARGRMPRGGCTETAAPGLLIPATPRPLPAAQAWAVAAAAPRAAWTSGSRAWRFGGAPRAGGPAATRMVPVPQSSDGSESLCARPGSRPPPSSAQAPSSCPGLPSSPSPLPRSVCVWRPYLTPGTDPPRPPSCPAPMTGGPWALGGTWVGGASRSFRMGRRPRGS